MNDQVEKAIAALRMAIENVVAAAYEAGKQEAGREAIAKMTLRTLSGFPVTVPVRANKFDAGREPLRHAVLMSPTAHACRTNR